MIIPPQLTATTLSKHGGYGASFINPSQQYNPCNFNPKKCLQVKPQLFTQQLKQEDYFLQQQTQHWKHSILPNSQEIKSLELKEDSQTYLFKNKPTSTTEMLTSPNNPWIGA